MSAPILGIDLGTTNSSCAFFDGREVTLIPNDRGSRTTPSVVALSDGGEVLVGESARNQAVLNPDRTIRNAKRLIGTGRTFPFGNRSIGPEQALSYVLKRLKTDAEAYLGEEAREAVVTVPAYFSEPQRRATREAGRLAGFEIRRLLNEPTAAAIAWAWSSNRVFGEDETVRNVLVYDLGGGTFDATVLSMRGSDCRVLSAAGDNALGGADFDGLLLALAIDAFERELGPNSVRDDPMLLQQLSDSVERAKMELSVRESATVVLPFFGAARGVHPSWKIERAEFEGLIGSHIDRSIDLVRKALAEAGVAEGGVDHLVLSGGSSRIPLVRRRLKDLVGREAEGRVNPDEIVAFGAAVFAGTQKEGVSDGFSVRDAVSRSFGVEIDGDDFVTLISKNTPIPVSRKRAFTTVADNQQSVEIHVLQGESIKASENLSLGRFLLSGIRGGKRGEPRIEVEFSIDPDEILHVRARDLDTGVSQAVTIASSPEGASVISSERLRSLAARASSLSRYAAGDRSLEAELEAAIKEAEKTASFLDAGKVVRSPSLMAGMDMAGMEMADVGANGGVPHGAPSVATTVAMSLEAIVAELEARRSVGG